MALAPSDKEIKMREVEERKRKLELKIAKDKRVKELMKAGVSRKIAIVLYDLEYGLEHHKHGYVHPPRY